MFLVPERDNEFGQRVLPNWRVTSHNLGIASMYQYHQDICINSDANTNLHASSREGHREEAVTIRRFFEKPHFHHSHAHYAHSTSFQAPASIVNISISSPPFVSISSDCRKLHTRSYAADHDLLKQGWQCDYAPSSSSPTRIAPSLVMP